MTVNVNNGLNAYQRGWGPGWPTNRANDMVWTKAGGIGISLHKDISELITLLVDETVKRGYRLDKQKDDWGFASRPITGSTTVPSNHSWGLAIDINAIHNPYGPTLVTNMPAWMPALWKKYGFRWGGTYSGNKDAMHYEFMGTPKQAKAMTAKAKKDFAEPVVKPPKPPKSESVPPIVPEPTPTPDPVSPKEKLSLLERLKAAGRLTKWRKHHKRDLK